VVLPRQAGGPRASLLTASRPAPAAPPLARRPARALPAPLPIPGSHPLSVGELMSFQYCRNTRRRLNWWYEAEARPTLLGLPVSIALTPLKGGWIVGGRVVRTLVTLAGNGEGERFTHGSRRRTRGRNGNLTASREGRDEGRAYG